MLTGQSFVCIVLPQFAYNTESLNKLSEKSVYNSLSMIHQIFFSICNTLKFFCLFSPRNLKYIMQFIHIVAILQALPLIELQY